MKFTVFTPTYNRAHTLGRVFQSLKGQSFKDFEWLIVDDGSTDPTKTIVESWKKEADFPIKYRFQKNQGKHIAINVGTSLASGEFFLIADSDDSFPSNALEIFNEVWNCIPLTERNKFSGVTGLCAYENGEIVGNKFPQDYCVSNTSEMVYKFKIIGEKWGFHKTSVLKKFQFPKLDGFNFYAEGVIWSQIGKHYNTMFVNRVVRTYYQDAGNQLTKNKIEDKAKNRIFYAHYLNIDVDYIWSAPLGILKIATQGNRLSLHYGDSFSTQLSWLNGILAKSIWTLCFPAGVLLYFLDLRKNEQL